VKRSAVIGLIAANVLVYLWQTFSPDFVEMSFALWPYPRVPGAPPFHFWQLVSYAFLHSTGNYAHLGFNMLGLWMFGAPVENALGAPRFLAIYFASVVTAALTQLIVPSLLGAVTEATIGASGGVFGLLLAFAMLFPKLRVVPLIPPIPMPAWLFATLYALVELFLGVTGRMADVAHFAHLGGLVGSFLVMTQWRVQRSRR
jgi:membrane associated rhomboid family serine protease